MCHQPHRNTAVSGYEPRPLGWVLKVTKRPTRMTDNVKTFLMKKFEERARTENKTDPVKVAKEKTLINEGGSEPPSQNFFKLCKKLHLIMLITIR